MQHAADGVAEETVAGPITIRAALAKAADAHHHQARMHRAQLLVADAPFFQRARPEIFDHDIEFGHQTLDHFAPFWAAQIECDELLVAQDARGIQRFSVDMFSHRAHRVAFGRFDLDHFGAEVRQQPAAERAGHG